jgi:hypothetical protein
MQYWAITGYSQKHALLHVRGLLTIIPRGFNIAKDEKLAREATLSFPLV